MCKRRSKKNKRDVDILFDFKSANNTDLIINQEENGEDLREIVQKQIERASSSDNNEEAASVEESAATVVDDDESIESNEEERSDEKQQALDEQAEVYTKEITDLKEENDKLRTELAELKKSSEPSKVYDDEILQTLISPINTLDQISAAYRNTGEHELVAEQLEKVAELTIQQIAHAGIEEIPVYGKEIDGTYMESFGPAQNISDDTLEPHSVAIVSRRAFKKRDSEDILQNALVYTVPEGE